MNSNFLDSKFMQVINTFVDLVYLSILWAVCSLPLVTIGLTSAALYHTIQKALVEEEGDVTKTFFRAFKQSWKQALPIGTLFLALTALVGYIFLFSWLFAEEFLTLPFALSFFVLMLMSMVQIYLYPLIGHFYLNVKQLFTAVLMVISNHPLKSFGLTLLLILSVIVVVIYPPLLMIVPAGYTLIAAKVCTPLFFRYIRVPESDAPSSGDLIISDDTQ